MDVQTRKKEKDEKSPVAKLVLTLRHCQYQANKQINNVHLMKTKPRIYRL